MERHTAEKIMVRGEIVIKELSSILIVDKVEDECTPEEYHAIRRAIGLAIGIIETELLSIAYRQFPQLDPIER